MRDHDFDRYQRQMLLPGFGRQGQERLSRARAAIVGVGALGCATADMLARAGVGTLTLIDRDVVEKSNLQRQCLFDEREAEEALPKAEAARRRLAAANSRARVIAHVADLTPSNAESLLLPRDADAPGAETPGVIIDGTDNFETRYLLNDIAVKYGIAYVYGGVVGTTGMAATFVPGSACLRCVFPQPPAPGACPTCDTAGVLGPAVQLVAACQAADALKVLLGKQELLSRTLLQFDLWTNERRRIALGEARRDCPCCALRRFEFLDRAGDPPWALCGQDAVQVHPKGSCAAPLEELADRWRSAGAVTVNRFLARLRPADDAGGDAARAQRGESAGIEITVFADGRAIVRGTTRPDIARSLYARYVGC